MLVVALIGVNSLLSAQHENQIPAHPFVTFNTGGIRGRLTDMRGVPMSRIKMTATSADSRVWQGLTDSSGQFRLGFLPPGRYKLSTRTLPYTFIPVQNLLVRPGAWLTATSDQWAGCGVGSERILSLAGTARSYDYGGATVTAFSSEELERLPLK